ncbi:MAG: N-acetylmuramoyl-L-alanine amidase [Flavobacteriaceae bacterium]|jgi:N-acetylmuramoyl-L-alanine amidase|nr:N-acetylmuramoyl-L-alanine amidase [Flavobacteriaceae bacterium]
MKPVRIILFFFLLWSISAFAQTQEDTPRNNEGIREFLQRNNRSEYYKQFLELNKGKFGKDNILLLGVKYKLPPSKDQKNVSKTASKSQKKQPEVRKNPLFGKKYENYTVKSQQLKGACFFLSSGHGGPDPGAVGNVDGRTLHEDEYAYDIILRLARRLLEEGAKVYVIIQDASDGIRDEAYLSNNNSETCMGEVIPFGQTARLKQRADKINSLSRKAKEKYKRSIFLHLDSRSQRQQLDVFFYYANGSANGKQLANTMKETFSQQYGNHQPNRGFSGEVSARNLYVLDHTVPVALFSELGNIQNSFDQRRFINVNNRQALANWLCKGLIKDYENSK